MQVSHRRCVLKDAWIYTGLRALNGGRKAEFLCRLCDELFKWTKGVAERYEEFPVGYTEWTLTGHMNIVAYRCDFVPYSDYSVKLVKGNRKLRRAGVARPDLDIHSRGWEDSWIFELKRHFISLPSRANLEYHILEKMQKAYDQLHRIAMSHDDWADHGCSALAFTAWMDWLVNEKNRWRTRWSDRQKYEADWSSLWQKWEAALVNTSVRLAKFGRIYYCTYRMPHSLVKRHYQIAVKEAEKEQFNKSTLPVAMLWVLAHKPWAKIATS